MGDFNEKEGSDTATFDSTMRRNENGHLVEFCSKNGMVISGKIFHHKDRHKYTWTSPESSTLNQIDHILVYGKYRRSVLDAKASRGADIDIGIDYQLVTSDLKFKLKRKEKEKKSSESVMMCGNSETQTAERESFRVELRNEFAVLEGMESEGSEDTLWESFQTVFNEVVGSVYYWAHEINSTRSTRIEV